MESESTTNSTARQPADGSGRADEARPAVRPNPLILYVDDEPDMLTLLRLFLSRKGFEVTAALNASEALQLVEQRHPDLIITDFAMPGMNGLEFCRTLRERHETHHIPIILYSSRDLWQDDPSLFDRFVLKPADLEAFAAMIRDLLAASRAHESE